MSEIAQLRPGPGRRHRPLLRTLIGEVLRRHRQGQRRTLADVAARARVSVPYLSEVERGRKEASSEVLAAVCGALRVELADLLAEVRRELVNAASPAVGQAPAHQAPAVGQAPVHQAPPVGQAPAHQALFRRAPAAPPSRPGDVMLLAA